MENSKERLDRAQQSEVWPIWIGGEFGFTDWPISVWRMWTKILFHYSSSSPKKGYHFALFFAAILLRTFEAIPASIKTKKNHVNETKKAPRSLI